MGEVSQNTQNIGFYKLIAKAEKADLKNNIAIAKIEKVGDEYQTTKWLKGLSGYLTKVEIREFEYEKKLQKKICLQLSDKSGICQLEFTLNGAAYGVLNCLLDADFTKEILVEAWITKANDAGARFVNAAVKYNGDDKSIPWYFSIDQLPKPQVFDLPSGKVNDFTNVKEFWLTQVKENIIPRAVRENFKGDYAPVEYKEQTEQRASVEAQAPYSKKSEPEPPQMESSPFMDESDLPF